MFSGRTTAEIISGHQDASALVFRPVEDEVRLFLALWVEAKIVEQSLRQALPFHRFEELFGDDLIGVDIGDLQGL